MNAYKIKHRNLHHALVEVRGPILDNLDCDDLLRLQVLAFHDLSKSALTEDVQYQVPIPSQNQIVESKPRKQYLLVPSLFAAEYIIDVQYVVAVIVVIAIIFDAFAWFGENSARVSGRFVLECRITYSIGRGQVCCQGLEWL